MRPVRLQSSLFATRKVREKELPIESQFKVRGIPEPVREHPFAPGRRWKFDYAWVDQMIAFEVEGGGFGRYIVITSGHERRGGRSIPIAPGTVIRAGGRHNTGAGMQADVEKYSKAAILGWCVVRATTTMIRDGVAIELLVEAFRSKGVSVDVYEKQCSGSNQ